MPRATSVALWAMAALAAATVTASARAADPTTADCLAASDASVKLRAAHKLREARGQLLTCAAASCPTDVRAECVRRVEAVNRAMPTIVFETKDGAGNDVSAVSVTMDGQPLVDRLEGTALSLDPGEHRFTFTAAGRPPVHKTFVIREGEKERRELVLLDGGVAPKLAARAAPSADDAVEPGLGAQRTWALVTAGVGLVGVGVGTVFGISSLSARSEAIELCPDQCATQAGVDKWRDATRAGDISTVGFVVGAAGLAGGALLWFTAPRGAGKAPQVGLGPGVVRVRGDF